ncbi:histidine kinase [Sphingomonas sp. PL-96]|uniref:ATP-binding protein n=1 Tax=Sphingomonas sp. PL-96 TaxID=2887201 RepID=UPI001E40D58D|nr:ATP-binding protein [Sphingomonas sp. PL-96]MCC2976311.1 histidine kinase [Sphingomonas sp. PL-96]
MTPLAARARLYNPGWITGLLTLCGCIIFLRPPPLHAAVRQFQTLSAAAAAKMVANPEDAIVIAQRAERQARAINGDHTQELARAHWLQGDAAVRLGQVERGRRLVELAMEEVRPGTDRKFEGDLLLTRGAANAAEGRVSAALADFQQAHRRFVTAKDLRGQALALACLASLYREGGDYRGALRYYREAEEASHRDPILLLSIFNGRGNVLTEMNRFQEASGAFTQALKNVPLDNLGARARILSNLGRAQLNSGDVASARATIDEGVRLANRIQNPELTSQVYSVAARVALEQGEVRKARMLIERSFEGISPEQTVLAMRDNHLVAAQIYRQAGEPEKALEHLTALRRLDEQALVIATSAKAALMGARFDFQNQELRIARLKAEELRRNVAFEQSKTQFQQILFGGIAGAVAILISLLTFGLITIRRSRNEARAANVDLGVANASLEKALAAKTEFLATTSHEIRTPLNGILGMTQVMLADPALEPATRERVDIVHGAGMRMRGMVDDILDVAKMENGNFTIDVTAVDLRATIADATELWRAQAQAREIGFTVAFDDVPRWIESDPSRLRQIVFNLLSNAFKFTHQGSVSLRVSGAGEPEARRLRIAVCDTGIGIPPDKHAQIFESFRQVDAGTTRHYGGTGLGLTICRNLAIALGGEIHVTSAEGEGATFTVDLPLVEVAAPAASGTPQGGATGMLVVDRNPIVRGMMKTLFQPHVPDLRFAATVDEALVELAGGGIARVVVDEAALSPEPSDTAGRVAPLVAAARASGAATVVLWPELDEHTRASLLAAGIDEVIAKPVSGANLLKALFSTNRENQENSALVSQAA